MSPVTTPDGARGRARYDGAMKQVIGRTLFEVDVG